MDNRPAVLNTPLVSYPYNDKAYPRIEIFYDRTVTGYRNAEFGTALALCPDLPDCKLVSENKVDDAGRYVRRVYDKLPGPALAGQEFDNQYGLLTRFTEQTVAAGVGLGNANTTIQPGDSQQQKNKVETPNTAALDALFFSVPGVARIDLPDILEGINVVWETGSGDGTGADDGEGFTAGTHGSLSLGLSASSNASRTLIPDIQPIIRPSWTTDRPVTHWFCFLPMPVTAAQLLAKLTTIAGGAVQAWPTFNPLPHTFTLSGQRMSLECQASAQQHVSFDSTNNTWTKSTGVKRNAEVSSSVKTVNLPAMLHAAITLTDASRTATISAAARAHMTGATNWDDVDSSQTASATLNASVVPSSLGITSPADYPASGQYLKDIPSAQPYKWGYAFIHAMVFNFADL